MAEEQFDPRQAREIISFQISYNKRRIKATWSLAAVIVLLYLLEEFFGGSQNVAVLVRMGANVSSRVLAGEYYRLFSSVFLHAGILHVFFNTYVLFALGGFFNRIMGEARYLTVFFISGIAGSLASVFFGKSVVSVGASGAIWGLFGASLGLALFRTSLIPEAIRLQLRRVTLINLIINLGISFLPMIDFWAHIGGGIAGFLVSLLIIFPSRNETLYRAFGWAFQICAVALTFIYALSIAFVLWTFQPWVDQFKVSYQKKELAGLPFSVDAPVGLKETVGSNNNTHSAYFVFGDPQIDRLVVELHFFNESILGTTPNNDWLNEQRKDLLTESSVPAQVKKSIDYRETPEGGVLYYQQPAADGDITLHNYVVTRDGYAIKLSVIVGSKVAQAKVDDVAKTMLGSIK